MHRLVLLVLVHEYSAHGMAITLGNGMSPESPVWKKLEAYVLLISRQTKGEIDLVLKPVPFIRLEELVAKGQLDGDFGREDAAYQDRQNSVVRVAEPIASIDFFILTRPADNPNDLDVIRKSKTAIESGAYVHQKICIRLRLDCVSVSQGSNRFSMLQSKRVGSILAGPYEVQAFEDQVGSRNFRLSKSISKETLYLFLAAKHEKFAGSLSAAIVQSKVDSQFQRIWDKGL